MLHATTDLMTSSLTSSVSKSAHSSNQSVSQAPPTQLQPVVNHHRAHVPAAESERRRSADSHHVIERVIERRRSSAGSSSARAGGSSTELLPYDLERYAGHDLLEMTSLSQWDFPVFDLADEAPDTVLSLVSIHC